MILSKLGEHLGLAVTVLSIISLHSFTFLLQKMPRKKTSKATRVNTLSPQKSIERVNDTDLGNSSPARGATPQLDAPSNKIDWKDEIINYYRNKSIRAWVCRLSVNTPLSPVSGMV